MKAFLKHSVFPWLNPAGYSASTKNWIKSIMALSLLMTGTGYLAFLVGGINALYSTIAFQSVFSFVTGWFSKEIVFWMYDIKPVKAGELVEGFDLHALLKEVSSHPNIACKMPDLGIHETDNLNAFATGRHTGHAGVAVTRGFLKYARAYAEKTKYTPEELLKAVLFHELGHIKHRDIALRSVISIIATIFNKLCHIAYNFVYNQSESKKAGRAEDKENKKKEKEKSQKGFNSKWIGLVVFVLGWAGSWVSKLLTSWFNRTRETYADETAFECDYGPQLSVALKMLEEGSCKAGSAKNKGTASGFFNQSHKEYHPLFCYHHGANKETSDASNKKQNKGCFNRISQAFSTHPEIDDRIEHLQTLEKEKLEKVKGLAAA